MKVVVINLSSLNLETDKKLIKEFVKLDKRDEIGCTMLHFAVYTNVMNLIKPLLEAGADVRVRDHGLKKAFHLYVEKSTNNKSIVGVSADVIEAFIDHGQHIDEYWKGVRLNERLRGTPGFVEGRYIKLSCLAAQSIIDNNIKYKRVPKLLKTFIKIHKNDIHITNMIPPNFLKYLNFINILNDYSISSR
jgi:hypothetical protein